MCMLICLMITLYVCIMVVLYIVIAGDIHSSSYWIFSYHEPNHLGEPFETPCLLRGQVLSSMRRVQRRRELTSRQDDCASSILYLHWRKMLAHSPQTLLKDIKYISMTILKRNKLLTWSR